MEQEEIKLVKSKVLSGELLSVEGISPDIINSWQASKDFGVPSDIEKLPDNALDPDTLARIPRRTIVLSQRSNAWIKLKEVLATIGGAVFYLDNHMCAYVKGGNKDLLDELKRRNVRTSTCFKESAIGANAASQSYKTNKLTWLIGEENYSSVFSDMALCSLIEAKSQSDEAFSISSQFFIGIIIVLPLANLTEHNRTLIEYIVYHDSEFAGLSWSPEVYIKDKIMNSHENAAIVIVDSESNIVHVNNLFCEISGLPPENLLANNYNQAVPFLSSIIRNAFSGYQITDLPLTITSANGNSAEYSVECTRVKKTDGSFVGIYIKIISSSQIKKRVKRVLNYNAHFTFDDIIGKNNMLLNAKLLGMKAAEHSSTVLISGESGTGKELFAQSIHNASSRANEPFVAINCASIPQELIGSELFGYVEGAFTGAKRGGSMGKFEQADKGTIFLDEISEMSLETQAALLRVLEEKAVTRLGDNYLHKLDVRVIAATNRDLLQCVQEGKFRLDLYYRLGVVQIKIPPLRDRKDDIPLLANSLTKQLSANFNQSATSVSPEAFALLQEQQWNGNVRELRNIIERCLAVETSPQISFETIVSMMPQRKNAVKVQAAEPVAVAAKKTTVGASSFKERQLATVKELMIKHNGNVSRVSKEMGISRGKVNSLAEQITDWD